MPQGAGIARTLAHPSHGNLAVALLARRPEPLRELASKLRSEAPGSVIEAFPSDTSPEQLTKAFEEIKAHESFGGLKLDIVRAFDPNPLFSGGSDRANDDRVGAD